MKITKSQLKQIIKEEILSEFAPVDGSKLKDAGDKLKAVVGAVSAAAAEKAEIPLDIQNRNLTVSTARQTEVTMNILVEFEKMFRAYEEQTNSRLDMIERSVAEVKQTISQLLANKADKAHSHGTTGETGGEGQGEV